MDDDQATPDTGDGTEPAAGGGSVLGGAAPGAYLGLFRNKRFRNFTLANLTSALGDWIGFLAIIALTADILGATRAAAFAVSGVMAARVIPSLLLGPVAGVFVDRWDRKKVLIWTDVGRGSIMAIIPFTDDIFALVLATLFIEMLSALFSPARDAVLPSLVRRDELVQANQVNLIVTYGTLPLGGVFYAGLIALAEAIAPAGSFLDARSLALPIWFNALSFWISAPLLWRIELPQRLREGRSERDDDASTWGELKEGLRFIGGHPVIRSLVLGVMVAFAAAGVVISTGEFFAQVLNAGSSGYGILVAVVGIGLVAGLLSSARLSRRIEPERLFAPGIGVAGVALVATALMPSLVFAALPAVIMGLGAGVSFIVGYTILQQRSDDRIRGRTFAAFNSGVRASIFGSTIAVPTLIGVLGTERAVDGVFPYQLGGIRITLIAGGVLAFVGAVLTGGALHRARTAEAERLELEATPESSVRNGVLVAFEGGDGSGKSTQIRLLRSAIERAGWDAVITREPGGTTIGETVRELLLSRDSDGMSDRAEALLYAAARAQHVEEVIRPALEKGAVVVTDRYVDSSVVYQGAGRQLGEDAIAQLNRWGTGGLEPDLVVLLVVDPDEGLRRAVGPGDPDRLEAAGPEFHRAVAAAYRRRAELDPDRYLVVDANEPVEDVHARVRAAVLAILTERDAAREAAEAAESAEVPSATERASEAAAAAAASVPPGVTPAAPPRHDTMPLPADAVPDVDGPPPPPTDQLPVDRPEGRP
ncbi:dTMP kinase [Nitriliruptoraceae bacterium ZYF776]|nr:dTMP kinase [Profundirhabdus halotolerans]